VPTDRALQRDALERECNYFPSTAREGNSSGRSLPALNAAKRLSEVPLTRMHSIHNTIRKCARRCKRCAQKRARSRISWGRARAEISARLGQWGFDCVPLRREDRQQHWRRFHYRYAEMRLTSHNGNNTPMRCDQWPNVHTRPLHFGVISYSEVGNTSHDAHDKVILSLWNIERKGVYVSGVRKDRDRNFNDNHASEVRSEISIKSISTWKT